MLHVPRENESDDVEQYAMEFRNLDAVKGNGKLDAWRVDWRAIKPDPANDLRDLTTPENRAHIEELKNSIEREGVREPLRVRTDANNKILATDGRCRLTALAELRSEKREHPKTVLVLPEPRGTSPEERNMTIVAAGLFRKNLDQFEIAEGIKRQIAFGWTEKQIADRLGWKSVATVKHHLDLLAMDEPMKERVRKQQVSATTARHISKNVDPELAKKLFEENERENRAIKGIGKRTKKVTPRAVRKAKEAAKPKPEPQTEPQERPPITRTLTDEEKAARAAALADARERETAPADQHVTDQAAPYNETLSLLIAITRQAHSILQHNKSSDNPGYWTREFEDAITDARAHIESVTGKPMEFETLPDPASQVVEEA